MLWRGLHEGKMRGIQCRDRVRDVDDCGCCRPHRSAAISVLPKKATATWEAKLLNSESERRRQRPQPSQHASHPAGLDKALAGPLQGGAASSYPCPPSPAPGVDSAASAGTHSRPRHESTVIHQDYVRRLCRCAQEEASLRYLLEEPQAQAGTLHVLSRPVPPLTAVQRQG